MITRKKNGEEWLSVFSGNRGNSKNNSKCGNVTTRPMSRTEATITSNLD